MIDKKIIFIGHSFVGKSAISSIVANKLNLKRLNFDSLLKYHKIYEGEEDELLDMLEREMQGQYDIIDIGGNTIINLSETQLNRLKNIISNSLVYYIRPMESDYISYKFLSSRVDKDKINKQNMIRHYIQTKAFMNYQKSIIKKDFKDDVYDAIKTQPTIYTISKDRKLINLMSMFMSNKAYYEKLQNVAYSIIESVKEKATIVELTKI